MKVLFLAITLLSFNGGLAQAEDLFRCKLYDCYSSQLVGNHCSTHPEEIIFHTEKECFKEAAERVTIYKHSQACTSNRTHQNHVTFVKAVSSQEGKLGSTEKTFSL